MSDDLHQFMRVGIVQFMLHPETMGGDGPVVESISRICHDPYFESIEITRINDPGARATVARMLADSQMEVGFCMQPIVLGNKLDLGSSDPAERKRALDTLKGALPQAQELGAHKLALLSGPDPGEKGREDAIKYTIEGLHALCKAAADASLPVALEVFDREIDKKALLGSTSDSVRVAAALREDFPDFGLMLDLSHLPLQGETTEQALTTAAEYLTHIHIGNCVLDRNHPLYGDTHPPFGIDGGENDVEQLTEFLDMLFEVEYLDGLKVPTVAFEVRTRTGESPELVLANAKRTLLAAWREL